MGIRIVYKGKDSKTCGFTEATRLIAEEGWSWTPTKSAKKTVKPKKAKVEVEAVVLEETPRVLDLGKIKE